MKAVVDGVVVAESTDIVEAGGYAYFPPNAVRMDCLAAVERTAKDLECPHGVRFYDVTVGGTRHARAAWSYESPKPVLAQVKDRFGFWEDVAVG